MLFADEVNQDPISKQPNDKSLSHLLKIAIESPTDLTDSHLEEVVDVWYRKNRRIAV